MQNKMVRMERIQHNKEFQPRRNFEKNLILNEPRVLNPLKLTG
nr:hypothetical protein Q903MT_gene2783 [Picea sitchensis]